MHPRPQPIIDVAREFHEFATAVWSDAAGFAESCAAADVWVAHRDSLPRRPCQLRPAAYAASVVIILSSSDDSASEWFARGIFDFVVEPFEPLRLRSAFHRASQYLERMHAVGALRMLSLPQTPIALLTPRRVLFVTASEIDWAQAAPSGVTVCARSRQYPVRETLAEFAERLPTREFIRLRRSVIVSVRCLKAAESRGHGELTVTLKGGRRIAVGPTYRHSVETLIESRSRFVTPA